MLWLQGQKVVMIVTNIKKIDFRRKKTYFISLSKSFWNYMYMYNGCAELLSLIVLWSLGKRGTKTKKQLKFYKQLGTDKLQYMYVKGGGIEGLLYHRGKVGTNTSTRIYTYVSLFRGFWILHGNSCESFRDYKY